MGLLIAGQIEGFVDILEIKSYQSVYQTQVPLESSVRQISRTSNLDEYCFATDRGLYFAKLLQPNGNGYEFIFIKEHYFKNKQINKFLEYKPMWFMAFEFSLPNCFFIISRV